MFTATISGIIGPADTIHKVHKGQKVGNTTVQQDTVRFNLAVESGYIDAAGEKVPRTDWYEIRLAGATAKNHQHLIQENATATVVSNRIVNQIFAVEVDGKKQPRAKTVVYAYHIVVMIPDYDATADNSRNQSINTLPAIPKGINNWNGSSEEDSIHYRWLPPAEWKTVDGPPILQLYQSITGEPVIDNDDEFAYAIHCASNFLQNLEWELVGSDSGGWQNNTEWETINLSPPPPAIGANPSYSWAYTVGTKHGKHDGYHSQDDYEDEHGQFRPWPPAFNKEWQDFPGYKEGYQSGQIHGNLKRFDDDLIAGA